MKKTKLTILQLHYFLSPWFWLCNILFGQEWEYIVFIAFLLRWQLHNHFSFDNIFLISLWPKRIGHGTGTVHVKSSPILFSQKLVLLVKRKNHRKGGKIIQKQLFVFDKWQWQMQNRSQSNLPVMLLLVLLMIGCLGGKFNFLRIQVTSLGWIHLTSGFDRQIP